MAASGPPASPVPDQNVQQYIMSDWSSAAYKTAVIFVDGKTRIDYTYGNLKTMVERFTLGLYRHGVRSGDIILIFSTNNVEYFITMLAAWAIGATVTNANILYTPGELARQINDAGATYVVSHVAFIKTCEAAVKNACRTLKDIIVIGSYMEHITWASILEKGRRNGKTVAPPAIGNQKQDVAVILYSSGTTGVPKGVMITHYNLVASITQNRVAFKLSPNNTQLFYLPMFHTAGLSLGLLYARITCPVVTMPRFDPELFFRWIQEFRIEEVIVVPPIAVFMYKSPLTKKYDLSSLKKIGIGAAPLKKETQIGLGKVLQNAFIYQAYGATEMTSMATLMPDGVDKPGAVGVPVPGTHIRIVDFETKQQKLTGEQGEVWFKGPMVMKGYLNRPDATAETIDEDGWLHTGDIGYLDADGYLYIVDRVKEMIKYKSYQVAPAELEAILLSHPGVQDAGVVGVPDKDGANELPTAFVVRKAGTCVTGKELQDFISDNVAPFKRLRGGIHFVTEVPRTGTGKIVRRRLKEMSKKKMAKY